MPGTITPLPIMLQDEEDRKAYAALEPPKTMVCRYGYGKQIAELPYGGDAKVGCGSKLVIRTARGIELAEMLTTTCANSGCGKSVSRKQMLDYIEASGGKDYPFTTQGRILRVATVEDLHEQTRIDTRKPRMIQMTKSLIREMDLPMRLIEVELLLGGDRVIFHYTAEHWVDFRELVRKLASEYQTRIEMHQVNAREEARLVADYEKCGQHCCCKQFLKVLKPVSMRSAKVQKATLDPAKISGRCGRLMCCLRYEDQTYDTLRKNLPHRQTRMMTEDGPGTVVDTQILTQLVLIRIDQNQTVAAYPVENITKLSKEEDAKLRQEQAQAQEAREARSASRYKPRQDRSRSAPGKDKEAAPAKIAQGGPAPQASAQGQSGETGEGKPKRRRRRRRRRKGGGGGGGAEGGGGEKRSDGGGPAPPSSE